jgi:hypothetical protein
MLDDLIAHQPGVHQGNSAHMLADRASMKPYNLMRL